MYASAVCSGKSNGGSGKKRQKKTSERRGFVARGCGAIMSDRKKNKDGLMAEKGLRAWVKLGRYCKQKIDGSYPKCGRSGGEKEKIIQNACLLQKQER